MIQPEIYENEYQLIEWLKSDLERQRAEGIEEEERVLNIGFDKYGTKVAINFDFSEILNALDCYKRDENGNIICPYKLNCINVTFSEVAIFSVAKFSQNADFRGATFTQNAYFTETTFSQYADFTETTFSQYADFTETTFSQYADFTYTRIKNTITFDNIKLNANESYMIFRNINYENEKFTKPHENSKIEIINTVINGRIEFNNVAVEKIDFKGSDILGGGVLNRINFEAKCENWETAVFLKNEAIKRSNTIEALKFKAIEVEEHEKELLNKPDKTIQNWAEIFSLKLSKLSNNHGQNWFRAFAFTLATGFVFFCISQVFIVVSIIDVIFFTLVLCITYVFGLSFYSIFLDILNKEEKHNLLVHTIIIYLIILTISIVSIKQSGVVFTSNYFKYLIPTNFDLIKDVYIDNILNTVFFYVFYILGKISIGYGIFEIIQAFRKFNTKGN